MSKKYTVHVQGGLRVQRQPLCSIEPEPIVDWAVHHGVMQSCLHDVPSYVWGEGWEATDRALGETVQRNFSHLLLLLSLHQTPASHRDDGV